MTFFPETVTDELSNFLLSKITFDILETEMVNVRSIRAILFSLILLLSLSQSGCSVFSTLGGWISQGYDNTVSYFNAYYNAKTLFDDAEAEVLAAQSAMKSKPATPVAQSTAYAGAPTFPGVQGNLDGPAGSSLRGFQAAQAPPIYQPPVPQQTSSGTKQKFNAVIDKCSNILSFYPKSSVVDDALFLIGKSYFYEDDFVRAERKFTELIVQDPSGPYVLSAQLWLLKTLQRLIRYDDANRVGSELVDAATKAEKSEIAGEALEIMGDIAVSQKKSEGAIELYTKAVNVLDNGPLRATAQAKIGDIYFSAEDYGKADSAYGEVTKYSPDPYGLYSSQLQAAIAYRRVGQYDAAIEVLRKLESDYRFMDFWGTIRSELAATFAANHKFDEAVDLYRLVDTTYARTEQGARAAFELGKLLQFRMGDYVSAKIAYTHAGVGGPQNLTQEAQRRAAALEKYSRLSDQFMKIDSMYFIIDIDSLWMRVDSSALTAKKIKVDSSASLVRRDTLDALGDLSGRRRDNNATLPVADTAALRKAQVVTEANLGQLPMILVKPRKDTLVASLGNLSFQLGELFYTDLDVPDSAFMWLNQAMKLGLDSIKSARALYVLSEVARANPEKKFGDEKDLYRQIVAKYPKSSYAEEARIGLGFPPTPRKVDPAEGVFTVAESLMVAGRYQPAIDSLRRLAKDYPDSPLAPKSRYMIAWIYENNLANPDSALSHYKLVVQKHPGTKYGDAALRRIPPVVADTTKKAVIGPTKKSAADTAAKIPVLGPRMPDADTAIKLPLKNPLRPDSLLKKGEFDDRVLRRGALTDSAAVRKTKKEVIE